MQSITPKEPVVWVTISHLDVLQSIIPVKNKSEVVWLSSLLAQSERN